MATPTYCDWESVKLRLAASLLVPAANLPTQYDDAIAQACRDAASEIKRIFIIKSYTPDQLAQSDDCRVWNEMLGCYFAAMRLCGQAGWDLKAFEALDCRKQMTETSALVIGDVAIAPADNASQVGGVASGMLTAVCQFHRFPGGTYYGGSGWPGPGC